MIPGSERTIRFALLVVPAVMILHTAGCGKETGPDTVPPDMVVGVLAAVDHTTVKGFWSPSTAPDQGNGM